MSAPFPRASPTGPGRNRPDRHRKCGWRTPDSGETPPPAAALSTAYLSTQTLVLPCPPGPKPGPTAGACRPFSGDREFVHAPSGPHPPGPDRPSARSGGGPPLLSVHQVLGGGRASSRVSRWRQQPVKSTDDVGAPSPRPGAGPSVRRAAPRRRPGRWRRTARGRCRPAGCQGFRPRSEAAQQRAQGFRDPPSRPGTSPVGPSRRALGLPGAGRAELELLVGRGADGVGRFPRPRRRSGRCAGRSGGPRRPRRGDRQ